MPQAFPGTAGDRLSQPNTDSNFPLHRLPRYHSSIVLTSYKKDTYLPHLLEDSDVILKVLRKFSLNPAVNPLASRE